MTAEIRKLRPKRPNAITQAIRVLLELPLGLSDQVRDELLVAANRHEPTPSWSYAMLSRDQLRIVNKKIHGCSHPALTLRVWSAVIPYVDMDTGEIMANRSRLAEDAATTLQEVSRALVRLADMGALLRIRPGRYRINPHVGWAGSLAAREAATQGIPQLTLVK